MRTVTACGSCGNGTRLSEDQKFCSDCRRIFPVAPGHRIDPSSFQWALDGQAMQKLRSIGPLTSMARRISDKVGRRWIETTFNGVRLSESQMPHVFQPALHAARLLGIPVMPDIYVSGERPWDALTFGTDDNAFIVMGSALVTSFRGRDLGFLFARELGHILAGHALWKTVIRFLVGEHNPRAGLMKNGVVGLLDPGKWIEGAIEVPLLGWARQAEVTADRAGLLAVGDQATARRVLLSWSLKSPALYRFINQQAWIQQQYEDSADENMRLTEMVTSSTPYITRRLKLLADFVSSGELNAVRSLIPQKAKPIASVNPSADESKTSQRKPSKLECPSCRTKLKIPRPSVKADTAEDKQTIALRCPNPSCRTVHRVAVKNRGHRKAKRGPSRKVEQQNLLSASD